MKTYNKLLAASFTILAVTFWTQRSRPERHTPARPSRVTDQTAWLYATPRPFSAMPEQRSTLHGPNSVTLAPTGAVKSEHWKSTLDEPATKVRRAR